MDALTVSTTETDNSWWSEARCRTHDGGLNPAFFSEDLGEIAAAKRLCGECPVLAECLEGAIARREPWGVWGGQLFMGGKVLLNKRRRGRPSKIPRPEDQLPSIPVPVHLQGLMRTA